MWGGSGHSEAGRNLEYADEKNRIMLSRLIPDTESDLVFFAVVPQQ